MYREAKEGKKTELTYNHYTVAVTFEDSKMVYKRQGDGNFHDAEIKRFSQKQGKPLRVVDVHSFAAMVCEARAASDLFVVLQSASLDSSREPLFWSLEEHDWVTVEGSYSLFSAKEKSEYTLPEGGEWTGYTSRVREGQIENAN